jgi:serpin B
VWAQAGLELDAGFVALLGDRYGAPIGTADMAGAPATALETSNDWVSSRTDGRIAHLLDAGTLAARPLLVLINALYFRGEWLTSFDPARTTEIDFHTARGSERVRYMRTVGELGYGRVAGAELLELPFRGGLDLLIVLPEAADGLPAIERRLIAGYERWTRSLSRRTVHAGIPRWDSRTKLDLGETLRGLGMRTAFGSNADFSGMLAGGAGDRPFSIGAVVQEATVSVDERGATAAAATAVGMYGLEARDEAQFNAVHPFLFFVRHTATGAVLLLGRVMSPKGG